MNKHTKMALYVAPFLILGGYILSDMWVESQAAKDKVVIMQQQGICDVLEQICVLEAGDLQLNIYDKNGETYVNSTFALDAATLFIVNDNGDAVEYSLAQEDNAFYWKLPTPIRAQLTNPGDSRTMRVIAQIKGGKYISEFVTKRT
ncbi:hypothetical protein [Psychrosphaera aestuarii]|uniref:hypothetical protein n=1 Tax=Psychrosphaera aestuarii TaxID=1266052 RepID=UPI001B32483B|nr:hypothetical protein [Psychrosphaera aestuarii]